MVRAVQVAFLRDDVGNEAGWKKMVLVWRSKDIGYLDPVALVS